MTWAELDSKFPAVKARYDMARSRYILRGALLTTLAQMLDLTLADLERRANDEKWDMLRIESLRTSAVDAQAIIDKAIAESDDTDPLSQHLVAADAALKIGADYLVALTSAESIQDARSIQAKALAYKMIVEGIRISIETARLVRGIALGQPSRTAVTGAKEVRLKVVYEDEKTA